jgi:hypothetical protein
MNHRPLHTTLFFFLLIFQLDFDKFVLATKPGGTVVDKIVMRRNDVVQRSIHVFYLQRIYASDGVRSTCPSNLFVVVVVVVVHLDTASLLFCFFCCSSM